MSIEAVIRVTIVVPEEDAIDRYLDHLPIYDTALGVTLVDAIVEHLTHDPEEEEISRETHDAGAADRRP